MIVQYNQNNEADLMGSWLSTGWNKMAHSTKVNAANLKKGGKKAISATKTNLSNVGKGISTVWDYTPAGIIQDAITGTKNPILNAVKVNAVNAKKTLSKISMNKIVDALSPETGFPDPAAGGSGIMKYLPIVAAGVGALTLLMGE